MKFNWGTGITITFVTFVALSLFQLYKSRQYDNPLVKEDYYVDDLQLEDLLKKKNNALSLTGLVLKENGKGRMLVVIPNDKEISGALTFMSPVHKSEDVSFPLKMVNDSMWIDVTTLRTGKWNVQLEWTDNQKEYLYQEAVILP